MKKIHYLNIAILTATLFVGNQSSAAIVYSGTQNVTCSQGAHNLAFSLFDAPGNWDDIGLNVYVFEDIWVGHQYQFGNDDAGNNVEFAVGSAPSDIKNFSNGATVDGSSDWSGNDNKYFSAFDKIFTPFPMTMENGEFLNTTGYAGMRLTDGANIYYGWIQVSVTDYNSSAITGTLIDWAYENTPGQAIQAGAIPEPSTAGLLFLGATIAFLVRGRRKQVEQDAAGQQVGRLCFRC